MQEKQLLPREHRARQQRLTRKKKKKTINMSGYLTEERKMMQEMARSFAREEVLPVANRLDPDKGEIPQDLIDKMGDLGFFGILIPEDKGGMGLGYFEYCLSQKSWRPHG